MLGLVRCGFMSQTRARSVGARLTVSAALLVGLASLAACHAWRALGEAPSGERLERLSRSSQYDLTRERFVNALAPEPTSSWDLMLAYWGNDAVREPDAPLPVDRGLAARLRTAPEEGLRVSWIGHSTLLIEIEGRRFLTDPVFSQRASPFRWLGPKRFAPPAIAIDELPEVDAVLISHDHYDHLDMDSIVALAAQGVDFIVPLGVGAHLEAWGVEAGRIHELDWWDELEFVGLTVACLPARHFSGRTGLAGNGSLWASWALMGDEARVFFSGDTSLTPEFSEVGARYGPFDIALVEVAAYSPYWADYHLGPEQAVEAFVMLRGRLLVPIHWGTFDLGLHGWTEPVERLRVAARARGAHLVVPVPGGSVVPSSPETRAAWWPAVPWVGAEVEPVRSSGVLPLALPATLRPLATTAESARSEIDSGEGQ